MLAHEKILHRFSELTGIRFRFVPDCVNRQAHKFTTLFSLEELELVVRFLQWKVQTHASGFTTASYAWRKLFGEHGASDEFLNFQERMGQAEEALKRGVWKPKFAHAKVEPEDLEPVGFREWMVRQYPRADEKMKWAAIPELVKAEYRTSL